MAAGLPVRELLQHLIEREAADLLARRELLERGDVFPDVFLRRHEQERAVSPPVAVVHGNMIGLFEWIGAEVE